MDLISFVFLILFFIIISWYLTEPLFDMDLKSEYQNEDNNYELNQRKEILYRQLKELELDHEIDNIAENDFIAERQNLKKEVSTILNKLED
ncbi:MAG: hypothetical protein CMG04_03500 [Candidatus Marinimicrobia bacterium]|nr:hypothetical protein [Candidatus Neomarinimicrobiota bacterium]|tara:strand:+ start:2192 stop:2464 length:273 start_codon:yes stop_codon:yes gene_type:complete